jgi:hypothetical protein
MLLYRSSPFVMKTIFMVALARGYEFETLTLFYLSSKRQIEPPRKCDGGLGYLSRYTDWLPAARPGFDSR